MSVVFAFEEEFFAEAIPGFKDSRKTYSSKSSKKKRESQLPKKVNSLKSLKSFANSFDNIFITMLLRSMTLSLKVIDWLMQTCFSPKKIAVSPI